MKNFKNLKQMLGCLPFVFMFGIFLNPLSAQNDTSFQYLISLDPGALFYNKQSIHIGAETYTQKYLLGTAMDFYVGILEGANDFAKDKFSFGITGKAGLDLLPNKRKLMHLGIAFRYDRLYVEDYDFDPFQLGFSSSLFLKSWDQFTPMMFFQLNTFNTKRVFMGIQINIGKTFLRNVKSVRLNRRGESKEPSALRFFEFPGLFPDAPIPSNRNGIDYSPTPDLRVNLWVGYRFGVKKTKFKD